MPRSKILRSILFSALLLASAWSALAQQPAEWTTPIAPFRIVGNVYYVGSQDLAAYLIVTPKGSILINSNLASSPPQIQASIEKLGFRMSDVKILLNSQAHFDHVAGIAAMQQKTHAKNMVMDGDVAAVESGGAQDFAYANDAAFHFPPAKVDRVLQDGDTVALGGVVLTAHKTAGHTRGCTTWTLTTAQDGKIYHIVIVGGTSVNPGFQLIGNAKYPQIAQDYAATFRTLESLPCDVFLGAHGQYFDLLAKLAKMQGNKANPFVDPAGYKRYVAEAKADFEAELAKQEVAAAHPAETHRP
jgi:metallo-beta-lactamase class B